MNETPMWQRIGPTVGVITLIIVLLVVIKWQHDTLVAQKESAATEMKQLRDDIVRAQTQYVSKKDLEEFAKGSNIDLSPIREDLAKLNAEIQGISSINVKTPGYVGTNLPSTTTTVREGNVPSSPSDVYGYLTHGQLLKLSEPTADKKEIPFGEVEFKAWEEKPWGLKVYPRDYSVVSVLGQDESGKHYTYHKFMVTTNGTTYPIQVTDAKFVEEKPEAKFRFSPRLYLGVEAGGYVYPLPRPEVLPNLQVSLFSYGQTKVNPTWTFLGLGIGYGSQTKTLGFVLTPVRYNVARHLPLVENLYIGPSVMVNTTGGIAILGGIGVGL